jgi:hypothetical protein
MKINEPAETISLACWECCAIYASPKDKPRCPNCGWTPTKRLVLTSDGVLADPDAVVHAIRPISTVPAFSLFRFNDDQPCPWAVTINDYGPEADSVSTILTFETEAEALAFIAEHAPDRKQ